MKESDTIRNHCHSHQDCQSTDIEHGLSMTLRAFAHKETPNMSSLSCRTIAVASTEHSSGACLVLVVVICVTLYAYGLEVLTLDSDMITVACQSAYIHVCFVYYVCHKQQIYDLQHNNGVCTLSQSLTIICLCSRQHG